MLDKYFPFTHQHFSFFHCSFPVGRTSGQNLRAPKPRAPKPRGHITGSKWDSPLTQRETLARGLRPNRRSSGRGLRAPKPRRHLPGSKLGSTLTQRRRNGSRTSTRGFGARKPRPHLPLLGRASVSRGVTSNLTWNPVSVPVAFARGGPARSFSYRIEILEPLRLPPAASGPFESNLSSVLNSPLLV